MPEGRLAENRRHKRVLSQLRCWCEGENVTVYARVGNLSEGGLCLRTRTPLPMGARTQVRLGDPQIEARAVVVWARSDDAGGPPGMGLMFEEMEADTRQSLRHLVRAEGRNDLP